MQTYNIQTYGASPNDGGDTTWAVRQALREMAGQKESRLVFAPGRYDFWPDRAVEQYLFVSNNDEGLKRIAFPLFGMSDVEIDGQGSEFVFHGFVVPFTIENCRNVCLKNFTVDWKRTFHSEAEVLSAAKDSRSGRTTVDFRIGPQFPYRIEQEQIVFTDEGRDTYPFGNILEFDPVRRETAFQVTDNYGVRHGYRAEQSGMDVVRLTGDFSTVPTPGNIAVIGGDGRLCPAVVITVSREARLTDVTIYHCGGMGVIAQLTEDIQLERVRVTPNLAKGRMISTTADATHFVNCRGLIEMTDCLFENQMDDPTNVHGIYARIAQIVTNTEIEIELVHEQQVGIDMTYPGDLLEFVARENLQTYHQGMVYAVDRLNKRFSRVSLASALPPEVKAGDAVASLSWIPNVTIRGCTTRGNRARGFLISTGGKTRIEDNHFHNPGAAILIAGDANFWFESGAVRDVTIRNNHFDNCNYGVWGQACIEISPEIEPQNRAEGFYHRNITIDGNTFDGFDPRLVKAHNVEGLTITNNLVRRSKEYPAPAGDFEPFNITDSARITLHANTFGGAESSIP